MELVNHAQTHPFVLPAVEKYAMCAVADTISTKEPVNLASLIAHSALMLPTVNYCIRLREGFLSKQYLE